MRRVLLLLGVLAFIGVTSAQPKVFERVDTSVEPRMGGTFTFGQIGEPRTFNPFVGRETSSTDIYNNIFPWLTNTYSPLGLAREGQFNLEGMLAESWEVQNDGLRVIFNLRRDAQWSDGTPITADDVVFSAMVHADREVNSNSLSSFYLDGEPIVWSKIDDYTVQVDFPQIYALALIQGWPIAPKHIFEQAYNEGRVTELWSLDTPVSQLISGGPFVISEYVPGERVVLTRNENFWGVDEAGRPLPYLDRLVYENVGDTTTALARFLAGEVDYHNATDADQVAQIIERIDGGQLDASIFPNADVTTGTTFIVFNWNNRDPWKAELFRNSLFRQAMAHLIDKDSMLELALGGLGQPQWSPVSIPVAQWFTDDVEKYEFDPARAQQLLASLGFTQRDSAGWLVDGQGRRLEFNLTTNQGNAIRERKSQIFAEDARAIGVRVNYQPIDFNELVRQLTTPDEQGFRDFDAILIGLTGGVEPPLGRNVFEIDGTLHAWNLGPNFEPWELLVDRYSKDAVTTLDVEERRRLYHEMQRIIAQEVPLLYTVAPAWNPGYLNRLGGMFEGEELNSLVGPYPYFFTRPFYPVSVFVE
jgi:peptide/nickel transport system substrate-binding protein